MRGLGLAALKKGGAQRYIDIAMVQNVRELRVVAGN
jgi:hypothetical protein